MCYSVLKIAGLNFKVASGDICGKSSDMLNKNTWGIKMQGQSEAALLANRQVQPKTLISAEANKLLYQKYF